MTQWPETPGFGGASTYLTAEALAPTPPRKLGKLEIREQIKCKVWVVRTVYMLFLSVLTGIVLSKR